MTYHVPTAERANVIGRTRDASMPLLLRADIKVRSDILKRSPTVQRYFLSTHFVQRCFLSTHFVNLRELAARETGRATDHVQLMVADAVVDGAREAGKLAHDPGKVSVPLLVSLALVVNNIALCSIVWETRRGWLEVADERATSPRTTAGSGRRKVISIVAQRQRWRVAAAVSQCRLP